MFSFLDMASPNNLFICFISVSPLLQLPLIKINDVQTLIINCVDYLLPALPAYSAKSKCCVCWLCVYHKNALSNLNCIKKLKFQEPG